MCASRRPCKSAPLTSAGVLCSSAGATAVMNSLSREGTASTACWALTAAAAATLATLSAALRIAASSASLAASMGRPSPAAAFAASMAAAAIFCTASGCGGPVRKPASRASSRAKRGSDRSLGRRNCRPRGRRQRGSRDSIGPLLRSTLAGSVASSSVHVRAITEGHMQPWHRYAASPALFGVPSPPTSHSCG